MGYTFRALASMAVSGVTDTQCGFKLLTRDAAALTLPHLHIERWAYDVEMLYVAQRLGLGVVSAQVPFEDVPGSKVTWWTPVEMLLDVLRVSTFYRLGMWELPQRGAQSNGKGSARPRRGTYTLLI
jgi:dolichyl-phosphate beta-glucosyltransferase